MQPARRAVLLTAGLGAIAGASGCSEGAAQGADTPGSPKTTAAPETVLRARAAKDSTELLARYDATTTAHPGLAVQLRPLRAEVARHAEAFGAASAPSPSPSASASASPSPSPSPSRGADPGDAGKGVSVLADAEQRLADARTTALLDASPELARLLASVAAAGAGHVLLLRAALQKLQKSQKGN
ncbi:hypothetical protein [Actinacidiphila oryziradicis]|uniref:Lipoprotein n=1 Tax=Actinacidiphila oryziradicis TaxID=2571141 RepID=A0A4U0S653_9ACTN|nr:hypothetical protein [Actinacidiphila oryziradicis]TKA04570.1 hypothetical protein FCI23_35505 [Actinacidiphila oryziradicis]